MDNLEGFLLLASKGLLIEQEFIHFFSQFHQEFPLKIAAKTVSQLLYSVS